ncbi:MAG: hypothetical protein AAFX99_29845 [Myxococcota bacterium]
MNQETVQITLNGIVLTDDLDAEITLADAITTLEVHTPEGEVFADIFVNDIPYHPNMGDVQLSTIETLKLHSQPVEDVAQAGVANLGPVAELCSKHFQTAARAFRLGRVEEGSQSFVAGAELLQDVIVFLNLLSSHHALAEDHPAQMSFRHQEASLGRVLTELERAQREQDWNQMADLIQFELTTHTTQLSSLGPNMSSAAA